MGERPVTAGSFAGKPYSKQYHSRASGRTSGHVRLTTYNRFPAPDGCELGRKDGGDEA
jgi:hypothetical protein